MRRPNVMKERYPTNSYIYIVGSQSDQIVKVFSSRSISVNDIWVWHLSTYTRDSLGIFAFRNIDEAKQSIDQDFGDRKLSQVLYKCSFNEMRLALLLEQRRQNGLKLPFLSSIYLFCQRILSIVYSWTRGREINGRKYLHDNTYGNPYFADIKICSEGFTN